MAIPFCLALTAHELANCKDLPSLTGYLACHFSPSGPGLSNLPRLLPSGSVLILDDRNPYNDHQAEIILRQLSAFASDNPVSALVLDFQRPENPNTRELAEFLLQLPYPVIAPPEYAIPGTPVLLPPCPAHIPLEKYIAPYKNRKIWLEIALDGVHLQITKSGCRKEILYSEDGETYPHWDEQLFCHYKITKAPDKISFTLRRTREDIPKLLKQAEQSGVSHAIGLWQELK